MAITLVQKAHNSAGTGPSLAVTFGAATTAGNFLVAVLMSDNSDTDTFTPPSGWSIAKIQGNASDGHTLAVAYAANIAGGVTSYTFNRSASGFAFTILIAEYSGVATASALDQTNSATASSTTIGAGSVTTTNANELLIMAGVIAANATYTAGASMTVEDSVQNGGVTTGWEDRILAATGTFSPTITASGSATNNTGVQASFIAAGGGGGTITTQTTTSTARITAKSTQTRTATARITATSTKTNTSTARITATSSQSRTSIARITATSTRTQTSTARITAKATQTRTSIARITAKTQQTNTSTAHIVATGTSTQTRTSTARIQVTTTRTNTSTARLQRTGTQTRTSTARLTAITVKTRTSTARVQATSLQTLNSTARIFNPASIVIGTCKVVDTPANGGIILLDKQTNTATLADKSTNTVALVDSAVNSVTLRDVAIGRAALADI